MGTSGNFSTSNSYVKYTISIAQNSQNITNNFSNVTVKVRFFRTNSGYTTYGNGTVYCKINGTTYSASVSTSQKITNSGIDLFSKTLDIYHNADGSKTLSTSAWISLDTPLSSNEQSYNQTLTAIPRASQPSLSSSDVTMGNSATVYTNRASGSFTHELYWQIGNGNWNWIAGSIGANYTWIVPINFANNSPNSTSLNLKMILETYSGSTYIGTNSVNLNASVPSSVVPTINSVTLTENTAGVATKFGCFVQGKSKITVNISASGVYSSTIKSYSASINNASYNSSNFTTDYLNSSGSKICSITVTDSRNRTKSTSVSYSVAEYSSPMIDSFLVSRCNSDGTANDEGSRAKCTVSASISSVENKNTKNLKIMYKKISESSWTTVNLSNTSYFLSATQIIENIDTESEYNFKLVVTDYFGSAEKSHNLSTAYTLIDYNKSGKGMAIGKVSTQNVFEVNMDIYAKKNFYSANSNSGIYLDENGNIKKQSTETGGYWHVANGNNDVLFKVNWGNKKINGGIGAIYQSTTLYINISGTTGTVTMSSDAWNYDIIDIMYKTNDGDFDVTRAYSPDGKTVTLHGAFKTDNNVIYKLARVKINNKTLTFWSNADCGIHNDYLTENSPIYIVQVVGYK